jgi:hypothetical protein
MTSLVYGEYESDDGLIVCALSMLPDTFISQGFVSPPLATPRLSQGLEPRVEIFYNSAGAWKALPYPTLEAPHDMGAIVTLRGDPTYVKVATVGEKNKGEAI